MELKFEFAGIEVDGSYPRVNITATIDNDEDPLIAGLAYPKISIRLPVSTARLAEPCQELAARAEATARQLVDPTALETWLQAQR